MIRRVMSKKRVYEVYDKETKILLGRKQLEESKASTIMVPRIGYGYIDFERTLFSNGKKVKEVFLVERKGWQALNK